MTISSDSQPDWPIKTLQVQLGDRCFPIKYPFSPAMKQVVTDVFQGREYPLCLPPSLKVETVVDVGANVGAAAIWFHSRYPMARIVCYEPSPSIFELLKENTAAIKRIDAKNIGLSDQHSDAKLHTGLHHSAQSSTSEHHETSSQSEIIQLRSASEEFEAAGIGRISILKLDTEGCEIPILNNIRGWMNRIDTIYVEYHSEHDRREIDQMLAKHFYLIRGMICRANLGTLVYLSRRIAGQDRKFVSPPVQRPDGGSNKSNI